MTFPTLPTHSVYNIRTYSEHCSLLLGKCWMHQVAHLNASPTILTALSKLMPQLNTHSAGTLASIGPRGMHVQQRTWHMSAQHHESLFVCCMLNALQLPVCIHTTIHHVTVHTHTHTHTHTRASTNMRERAQAHKAIPSCVCALKQLETSARTHKLT
jgi:hypothetical protein